MIYRLLFIATAIGLAGCGWLAQAWEEPSLPLEGKWYGQFENSSVEIYFEHRGGGEYRVEQRIFVDEDDNSMISHGDSHIERHGTIVLNGNGQTSFDWEEDCIHTLNMGYWATSCLRDDEQPVLKEEATLSVTSFDLLIRYKEADVLEFTRLSIPFPENKVSPPKFDERLLGKWFYTDGNPGYLEFVTADTGVEVEIAWGVDIDGDGYFTPGLDEEEYKRGNASTHDGVLYLTWREICDDPEFRDECAKALNYRVENDRLEVDGPEGIIVFSNQEVSVLEVHGALKGDWYSETDDGWFNLYFYENTEGQLAWYFGIIDRTNGTPGDSVNKISGFLEFGLDGRVVFSLLSCELIGENWKYLCPEGREPAFQPAVDYVVLDEKLEILGGSFGVFGKEPLSIPQWQPSLSGNWYNEKNALHIGADGSNSYSINASLGDEFYHGTAEYDAVTEEFSITWSDETVDVWVIKQKGRREIEVDDGGGFVNYVNMPY